MVARKMRLRLVVLGLLLELLEQEQLLLPGSPTLLLVGVSDHIVKASLIGHRIGVRGLLRAGGLIAMLVLRASPIGSSRG